MIPPAISSASPKLEWSPSGTQGQPASTCSVLSSSVAGGILKTALTAPNQVLHLRNQQQLKQQHSGQQQASTGLMVASQTQSVRQHHQPPVPAGHLSGNASHCQQQQHYNSVSSASSHLSSVVVQAVHGHEVSSSNSRNVVGSSTLPSSQTSTANLMNSLVNANINNSNGCC